MIVCSIEAQNQPFVIVKDLWSQSVISSVQSTQMFIIAGTFEVKWRMRLTRQV
jgi:hypothetical protein